MWNKNIRWPTDLNLFSFNRLVVSCFISETSPKRQIRLPSINLVPRVSHLNFRNPEREDERPWELPAVKWKRNLIGYTEVLSLHWTALVQQNLCDARTVLTKSEHFKRNSSLSSLFGSSLNLKTEIMGEVSRSLLLIFPHFPGSEFSFLFFLYSLLWLVERRILIIVNLSF